MQTKRRSVIEALTNISLGLGLSIVLNYVILTYFGFEVRVSQMTWLAFFMTLASFIRSYYLRRFFNWWDHHA